MAEKQTRGITRQQIQEAIEKLVGAGEDPTTTKIRQILGTGSYTTIGTVLQAWREKLARAKPAPQIPESIEKLFVRAWIVAVDTAATAHETEKAGFISARTDLEKANAELLAEVKRLEDDLESKANSYTELQLQLEEKANQIAEMETVIARVETQHATRQSEIERLISDNHRAVEQIAQLSERAAAAETTLAQNR